MNDNEKIDIATNKIDDNKDRFIEKWNSKSLPYYQKYDASLIFENAQLWKIETLNSIKKENLEKFKELLGFNRSLRSALKETAPILFELLNIEVGSVRQCLYL